MIFSRRKWGWYLTLISARQFKVKLLWFKKGQSCSEQRHFKRGELWLFIFGHGQFMNCGKDNEYVHQDHFSTMRGGDSEHVAVGDWHQFEAKKNTLVLEIQYSDKSAGYYESCIEEDIERAT